MFSVFDVASFFLSRSSMSQKKLQKLVYYAYAWTLTLLNDDPDHLENRLFNEEIQAWVHGPVCPALYQEYRSYGWADIPPAPFDEALFNEDVLDVLEQVWEVYGGFTGNQLESISHREEPWKAARGNCSVNEPSQQRISDELIFRYYNERVEG